MKKSILIILLLLQTVSSFCQMTLEGTYLNSRDTLNFHNDMISFSIMSNGGLIYPMKGMGKYELTSDLLIIKTAYYQNKPDKKKEIRKLGDTEYLEFKTLIFKVRINTEDDITLVLIGICDTEKFKKKKTVRKFTRNHKKLIYRERQLKKENRF